MALYRTGQASMSADGVITGYKTKWMQPLSLIRKEATIMFLSPNGLKLAVIAEIISDTEMRAIATGGAVVEKCDYVILIHDSLTVDGMAQDVAETLRYYRGKETEFAHLIEVIEDLDLEKIRQVVEDMRAEVAKFEENFKKIEAKAQEVQTNANKVADELAVVQSIHVRVDELNEQAKANADRANQNFILSQDEVRKARQEADNATAEAIKARDHANRADQIITDGKQEIADAVAAGKIEVGQGIDDAVAQATAQADRAHEEANRASEYAKSLNTENLLRKDLNLSDLLDKDAARKNLGAENVDLILADENETRLSVKGGDYWLVAHKDNGTWGYYNGIDHEFIPLGVAQGGTGGNTPAEARLNLGLDRFDQRDNRTAVNSPSGQYSLEVGDDGVWGLVGDGDLWESLGVEQGGTGASNAADARNNLDLERYKQSELETSIDSPSGNCYLTLKNDMWGYWNKVAKAYMALGIGQGGTGATSLEGARVNLQVDRLGQFGASTNIKYPSGRASLVLRESDLLWGVWSDEKQNWHALPIACGGTGAGDSLTARKNIGAASSGINTDITETQKLKNIWGANRVEFLRDDLEADIQSLKRGGDINDEKFLRSFRCSGGAQIWHETVKNVEYKLSVGITNEVEVFKIHSSAGVYFKGVKMLNTGDFGLGAVNSEQIADGKGIRNGLYSALANDNQLGTAWSIAGQAVGVLNLSMHPTRGGEFTSQIATSYSTNGRVFYRCTIDGVWKAWKEFALNGATGFNFGSGLNVSNTQGAQTYVSFDVINRGRPATDNGSKVSIEIPYTTERPYMLQRRNDGSTAGQIVNKLPTLFGEFMVRNAYKLNLANGNFNNYVNTQFTTFISGGTAHGTQNTPNVGYGNMMVIGTGNIGTTGDYATQVIFDKSTAIPYLRCMNDNAAGTWTAWQKVTVAAVSDANLKNIRGNMNVEGALDNINRMEFKIFSFKDDVTQRYRRGVISQQIKKIDKDYVNMVGDRMVLDQTPMMLDGLAAIKALRARDEANKERISKLEKEVEELKSLVAALINKPTTLEQ